MPCRALDAGEYMQLQKCLNQFVVGFLHCGANFRNPKDRPCLVADFGRDKPVPSSLSRCVEQQGGTHLTRRSGLCHGSGT